MTNHKRLIALETKPLSTKVISRQLYIWFKLVIMKKKKQLINSKKKKINIRKAEQINEASLSCCVFEIKIFTSSDPKKMYTNFWE